MSGAAVSAGAGASPDAGLRLRGVGFGFGDAAIFEGFDLHVPAGSVTAVVGPSGSGKSTLLRLCAGLLAPSAGAVERPAPVPGRAGTGLVFQDARLLPWRSVEANVHLALEASGVARADWAARTVPLLARVGLADAGALRPGALSGGMAQRAALVRGLALRPRALLLDEPFAAVDPLLRESLQGVLQDLLDGTDTTVLMVTHDVAEALVLADRVLVLRGRPARIACEVAVPLPRPRAAGARTTEAFRGLEAQVRAALGA